MRKARRCGLDTETTGVDLAHGARPFVVTTCEDGVNTTWRWPVDRATRKVLAEPNDLMEIAGWLDSFKEGDELILQNPKFDYRALWYLFDDNGLELPWNWEFVRDTLLLSHLLASNQPHDLTTLVLIYLKRNIQPLEDAMEVSVKQCRNLVKELPSWRIAKAGLPEMPSAREKTWKFDMWVPYAMRDSDEAWSDSPLVVEACERVDAYYLTDSACVVPLHEVMLGVCEQRGLVRIYKERLKVLPIVSQMEANGVTGDLDRLNEQLAQFQQESREAEDTCVNIANDFGFELELPKSGNNKSLTTFIFDGLKLPPLKLSGKTGKPSLDKGTLEAYQHTLSDYQDNAETYLGHTFVTSLRAKRKRDTAISYQEGYKRFMLMGVGRWNTFRLFPSLNPTGTDTLRWSSSNPNEHNISKQEGFNLRYSFGPGPGREWWSCDAKNLELRLPAYEAGETEMIQLFERPDDPPYFGSNHLLVFDILYPELFKAHGADVKKLYASTYYQWVKNGNFAVQYGAMEESGTADRAYHLQGAQRRIQERFSRIAQLNQKQIEIARRLGYVETMPDKTVDPERGYPLLCSRSKWGQILPTVPLNYHVQGTAMWWMMKAMIRCYEYLKTLDGNYFMTMQIHDELVFDFPKKANPTTDPTNSNLPVIRHIQNLMEQGGDDIGVPTPVSCEYHEHNWSVGVVL